VPRFVLPTLAFLLYFTAPYSHAVPPSGPTDSSFALTGSAYVGGFHAGDAVLHFNVRDDSYSVRFNAESQGLIRLLFQWGFELEVQGTLASGQVSGLQPAVYQSRRYHRDGHVERHVRFRAGVAETILPEGADPYPIPVPSEERRHVLDPASAVISAGLVLARTGRCDQTIRVFDGKTRSNLVLTDSGDELAADLQAADPGSGDTKRCAFQSHRVAGFSERHLRKPPVEGEIWFRAYGDDLMVPVRLQTPTLIGMAIFHFELPAG
jgi:hypothetical protein